MLIYHNAGRQKAGKGRAKPAMVEIEKRIEWVIPAPSKLFTPAVTIIIVLLVAGFLITRYAGDFALNYLALSKAGILHGRIWQLVTYPFVDTFGYTLVFNGLLVLFVGSTIEREWRTGSFVLLWLIVSVVCGLIWVGVSALLGGNLVGIGAAAGGFGLIAVWGLLNRRRKFFVLFWPIEGRHIAWILIVIGIVSGIRQPITWIWVSGALVAYLYTKLCWRAAASGRTAPAEKGRSRGFVDID